MEDIVEFLRELANQDANYIPVEESINTLAADEITRLRQQVATLTEQRDAAMEALRKMNRAYVSLMENGRNRIVMLGGECDPVDVMERADPALIEAKKTLAAIQSGEQQRSQAAQDVLAERRRQVEVEGWTPEHDDQHADGQMALAAACYAFAAVVPDPEGGGRPPFGWPWDSLWWKTTTPRRDLVKAGALILAEIERLDRAAIQSDEVTK